MQNIYQTINSIMQDIEPIGKESVNKQQGFKYRGVDAVMNALQPLFAKHKLFCLPEVINSTREERNSKGGGTLIYSILRVKYTFFAEDGSYISAVVEGEGMDSGDKSTNKALAIAFKYVCFQLFCIPTEETSPDPDGESPEPKGKNNKPKQPEQTSPIKEVDLENVVTCDMCHRVIKPQQINGEMRSAELIKENCGGVCLDCYMKKQEFKNGPVEVKDE